MCFNIPKWKDIGASKVVIDWISNGVPIIFDSEPQPFYRENHSLTVEQYDFVDKKVAELLLAGAIEQLDYQPYCVSPLGTAPKKGEIKYRLIHDLVELNDHCFNGFADGPGRILTPFFSLIRPNYSNMKRPLNSLLEKIVIGQIDRGIWDSF